MSEERSSHMGPAIFVGLTVFALVFQGEPEVTYLDPAQTMEAEVFAQEFSFAAAQPLLLASAAGLPVGSVPKPLMAQNIALVAGEVSEGFSPEQTDLPRPVIGALEASLRAPEDGGAPEVARTIVATLSDDSRRPVPLAVGQGVPGAAVAVSPGVAALGPAPEASAVPFARAAPDTLLASTALPLSQPDLEPAPAAQPIRTWRILTGDFVNVRAGPGVRFDVVGQVDRGRRALVLDGTERWSRVHIPGAEAPLLGWVSTRYLAQAPSQAPN